ncbi:hypothetical protein AAFN75_02775 [Algibacter sp. AS12]|uniref:hypothetical protein n=1 Tax=Algibacter sp. AS12 TaxID=3135773 RepID=UPI00398AB345
MKAILTKTRKRLFLILLIATLIGCNSKNKKSIIDTQKTTSQKVFSAVIDSINLEINNGDYGLIDRFMIIQNDSVLADFKL